MKNPMTRTMFGAICLFAVAAAGPARAASDEQNVVTRARVTIDDAQRDREFGTTLHLLRRAKAVMIIPNLIKGGFFVGGEGGTGVLLFRTASGGWSYPAFYTLASASFGLQIGGETAEVVLVALTDKARNAFLQDQFKIGAQAGLAVVTLGSTAEAATTSNLDADIVAWSSSTGAYAGLTVNGSIIKPRHEYDQAYYRKPVTSAGILEGTGHVSNRGANTLRAALAAAG